MNKLVRRPIHEKSTELLLLGNHVTPRQQTTDRQRWCNGIVHGTPKIQLPTATLCTVQYTLKYIYATGPLHFTTCRSVGHCSYRDGGVWLRSPLATSCRPRLCSSVPQWLDWAMLCSTVGHNSPDLSPCLWRASDRGSEAVLLLVAVTAAAAAVAWVVSHSLYKYDVRLLHVRSGSCVEFACKYREMPNVELNVYRLHSD